MGALLAVQSISVSVQVCLGQTWSSRDLSLGLETSRDPFLQVLVSVSVLGLETVETRCSSLMKRETETR